MFPETIFLSVLYYWGDIDSEQQFHVHSGPGYSWGKLLQPHKGFKKVALNKVLNISQARR